MKIITSLDRLQLSDKPLVIALGNFDGVHLGHRQLLKITADIAKSINGEGMVFTFYPHPQLLLTHNFQMLNIFEIKTKLISSVGIDYTLIIPFTNEIAKLSPREFFVDILCKKLNAAHLVAGFNYSFGYQGRGKAENLRELAKAYHIDATIMEPFFVDGEIVSSSKIREHLKSGEIKNAAKLLGYNPLIAGKVTVGNKIGRTIGFPTANLDWNREILIPGPGVYIVKVKIIDTIKYGVLNIGYRPTVDANGRLTMEVNIFDFNENIYNQNIYIEFIDKLRDEQKFKDFKELKEQISRDAAQARLILNKLG
ncbi:MAG: bifunctional riboflavin kinase/FAD synthetase [Peptococcaceae bacterium]